MKECQGIGRVSDARSHPRDAAMPELRALATRLDESDRRDGERDRVAAKRHQALLNKLEANRREIILLVELAITKSKLEELQASRSQGAQPPQ